MTELAKQLIEKEIKNKTGRLDLGKCGLSEIPATIFEMPWLEELSFLDKRYDLKTLQWIKSPNRGPDNNIIASVLPKQFEKLSNLKLLNLRGAKVNNIRILSALTYLESLDLSANQIKDINILEGLTRLQFLDLSENQICDIDSLGNFPCLSSLDLSFNQVSDISILKKLTDLHTLKLNFNHIDNIDSLANLKNLNHLSLSGNQISDIYAIGELTGLQLLWLLRNQISDISVLKKLTGLQSVDLRHNQINDIMPLIPLIRAGMSITYNPLQRESILIENNPIATPPISIIKQGSKAIINWFEQIEKDGKKPLFEAKLMILGQGGVGKTTFANLQLDPHYAVISGNLKSTLGIEVYKNIQFPHHQFNEQTIKVHLYDFGGQDIQKMLHQFFITEDCLYVLVSDRRRDHTHFDYWFQIINLLGPQSRVLVLENPIDIESATEKFALKTYEELFSDLHIDCQDVNLQKIQKEDKTKWMLLNEKISKYLSEMEIVNRPVPKKWSLIRDELEKVKHKKYISKDEFNKICLKPEIDLNYEDSHLCLLYLRSLGDLVYFEDSALYTYIFLDHNWLTKGMYYILSDQRIMENHGAFTRSQAYWQLHEQGYNEIEKALLLRLLLKDNFDICYELPGQKDTFITPLLLPNDKPVSWNYETNVYFRYQYGFMPHGIFSRLIVQLHEKIDKQMNWKTGIRLIDTVDNEIVRAEVQQKIDPQDNQQVIDIKINGNKQGCKQLLSFIRLAVEKLHKDFRNIKYHEKIACNCNICTELMKRNEMPSFFDYKKLQSKLLKGKLWEECEKADYKEINIGQILSDVIIENAAISKTDTMLLKKLKETGINIQTVRNEETYMGDNYNFGNNNTVAIGKDFATVTQSNVTRTNDLKDEIEHLKNELANFSMDEALKSLLDYHIEQLANQAGNDRNNPVIMKSIVENIKNSANQIVHGAAGSAVFEILYRISSLIGC